MATPMEWIMKLDKLLSEAISVAHYGLGYEQGDELYDCLYDAQIMVDDIGFEQENGISPKRNADEKPKPKKLVRNAIRCLKCGDEIESKSVHDFVWCSCQSCAVDGGLDYARRVGHPWEWEDISEWKEVDE